MKEVPMAEEAQKQASTERRPGTVSLMPWNNTSTSATRAVIAIGVLIAVPFLAAVIYSIASKGDAKPAKSDPTTSHPQ
jgi:hypothetical protein